VGVGAPVRLSRAEARAFLVDRLLAPQPDVAAALAWLGAVQMDPVSRVAPSHHLSLALRVSRYRPEQLERLRRRGGVLEVRAHERCLVPTDDLAAHLARQVAARERHSRHRSRAGEAVDAVLARIAAEGPRRARSFEGGRVEGMWDAPGEATTKSTSLALEVLWVEGRLAVARRQGNERTYDLFERVVGPDRLRRAQAVPGTEAAIRRLDAYVRAVRLCRAGDPHFGFQHGPVADRTALRATALAQGRLARVEIEGVRAAYWARPEDLDTWPGLSRRAREGAGRAVLVPPLDNLLWHRPRLEELFAFAYRWEVYTPVARRSVGPYGMPLLVGDEIWGQADARLDRQQRQLWLMPAPPQPGVRPAAYRRALVRAGRDLARTLRRFEPGPPIEVCLAAPGG